MGPENIVLLGIALGNFCSFKNYFLQKDYPKSGTDTSQMIKTPGQFKQNKESKIKRTFRSHTVLKKNPNNTFKIFP